MRGILIKWNNFFNLNRKTTKHELRDTDCRALYQSFTSPIPSISHKYSAQTLLGKGFSIYTTALLLPLFILLLTKTNLCIIGFLVCTNLIYITLTCFKNLAFWIGYIKCTPDNSIYPYTEILKRDLPLYTVLIPIFKEEGMIGNIIYNMTNIQYPKDRLEILLILEESDKTTIEALKKFNLPYFASVILVPYSLPQTKAKACNYALPYASGEYIVIYDAEDIADPTQLQKSVYFFTHNKNVSCIQSRLHYYNAQQNFITKMFSIEYAILFDYILPGMEYMNLPIPLGGTSNHIKMRTLREIGAWDQYNVTEDAELGVRLAIHKNKVAVMDSITYEESPSYLKTWLYQRARWIKGRMQTCVVYTRNFQQVVSKIGVKGLISIQCMLGLPSLSMLITPYALLIVICDFFFNFLHTPMLLDLVSYTNLILHFFLHIAQARVIIKKLKWESIIGYYYFLFPLYFLLHMIAAVIALYQLITKPHHWNKTPHYTSQFKT